MSNNTEIFRFLVIVSKCYLGKYCPFCSARSTFKFYLFVAIRYLVRRFVVTGEKRVQGQAGGIHGVRGHG